MLDGDESMRKYEDFAQWPAAAAGWAMRRWPHSGSYDDFMQSAAYKLLKLLDRPAYRNLPDPDFLKIVKVSLLRTVTREARFYASPVRKVEGPIVKTCEVSTVLDLSSDNNAIQELEAAIFLETAASMLSDLETALLVLRYDGYSASDLARALADHDGITLPAARWRVSVASRRVECLVGDLYA